MVTVPVLVAVSDAIVPEDAVVLVVIGDEVGRLKLFLIFPMTLLSSFLLSMNSSTDGSCGSGSGACNDKDDGE